jgi:hypothetical protein
MPSTAARPGLERSEEPRPQRSHWLALALTAIAAWPRSARRCSRPYILPAVEGVKSRTSVVEQVPHQRCARRTCGRRPLHKAIIRSGPVAISATYKTDLLTAALLTAFGEPEGGIDALPRADPTPLIQAQTDVGSVDRLGPDRDHAIYGSGAGLRPRVDGVVVDPPPTQVVTARGERNVPLLIGTNRGVYSDESEHSFRLKANA